MSPVRLHPDIAQVLYTPEQIQARVKELARQISTDYEGREPHLVCVLRGAVIFAADLLRRLEVPATIDFIAVSSYGNGAESSGIVRIEKDLQDRIEGRPVILVEDIIDSGLTLAYVTGLLEDRRVASLDVCAFLHKPEARKTDQEVRYLGFAVPNTFVVGYGLDYAQRYRGLPYVGVLRSDVYGGG